MLPPDSAKESAQARLQSGGDREAAMYQTLEKPENATTSAAFHRRRYNDDQAIDIPEDSIVRIKPETRAAFLSTMNLCLSALQRWSGGSHLLYASHLRAQPTILSTFSNRPSYDKPDKSDVLRDGRAIPTF
jgi:hypothetical protein